MSYATVLAELNGIGNLKKEWDLRNIRRLLSLLGNPEQKLRIVNVTGTNGKGSATVMLSAILREAGYSVGTYTSPHMDDFRERISINARMIPPSALVRIYSRMKSLFRLFPRDSLSFFEITTAIALEYFAEKGVDFAVLEAGMGGRLDATNVGPQELLVITTVDLDHTAMLGGTVGEIAREKAGLLRGKILLTGETKPEALRAFRQACKRKGVRLIQETSPLAVKLRLLGKHQFRNAAIAAHAARLLVPGISSPAIRNGLSKAFIPGRMEIVSRSPLIVMDGAHNPAAAKALAKSLSLFRRRRLILVFGAMRDKDADGVLRELAPLADVVILNQPALERAMPLKRLARIASKYAKDIKAVRGVRKSLALAKRLAKRGDLVLVTGSLYMLAEARGRNNLAVAQ